MEEAGNNLETSLQGADDELLLHENSGGCMELRGWREGKGREREREGDVVDVG